MKRILRHLPHYLSLTAVLLAGLVGFRLFSYDPLLQAYVAVATAAGYVVWGVSHHTIHKDLYLSVVVEYVIYATLGLVIILSLIFRI